MMIRALFLALACAYAAALSPLAVANDDSDCALYLSGPGRSSAYDYSINLLKGNFGYDGQHTCITYDAINQAYLEARNRILVSQPKGDWKPEDYASVGELVLDISISLARRYGLTYEEVEKGLPLIDTSRTLIREVCPPVFSHVECRAGKYRRFDGLCNNLRHPTWGATNAPFQRLIGPLFSDGINAPRISHTGRDLPLSRVVSRTMHPDDGFHDHAGTVMVIAWGQFMDHDYTLTGTPLDPLNRNDPEECCKRPPHLKHPYCNEIRIPDDDYFYRLFGVKCIDFVRAFPSPRPGCRLGSRVAFNTLTGVIDGNTVYGVTEKFARKLRTGFGGLLRMNPVFKDYGLKDLLPLKLDIPDEGCTRPNKNMYCFEAGEIRVNEQLVLTVMHTLMAREHNRVARGLAEVNPHWDDETLFQEARRINIAEIQHITYNEFLPILLGKDVMEKFGLVLEKEGYWDGYDSEVNPDVIASFAAAAYRFGHSLLPTAVERWSKAHKFIASKRLSDLIRRPYDLYRAGVFDEYVMGLMNQVAQAMDDSITQEVTNHLFKKVGARFGMDLVSFNMQRGREFGLPGYMEFRKFCGLPGADSFQELFGSMANHTVRKYETIFEHPIDVDLWSGGVSERPLPGSMLGPTFACIIATQFSYSRRGDRFWFELPNQPSSFTPEQLAEIRKSRLARVICDNTDIIDTVQLYPMVLPDHELNPRVPCRSGIIPGMDFSKWAEPAPFHGPSKHFITDAIAVNNATRPIHEQNKNKTDNLSTDSKNTMNIGNINNTNCSEIIQKMPNTKENCDTFKVKIDKDCDGTNLDKKKMNVQNCHQENAPGIDNCTQNKKNEIPNNDTILKYVYKKSDKVEEHKKSKGHEKNSLRRKRSVDDEADHKAPLIVNYETSHDPHQAHQQDFHHGVAAPVRSAEKNIKASTLADFNIETLHANHKPSKNNYDETNKLINSRPIPPDVKETLYSEQRNIKENEATSESNEAISRENESSNEKSEEYTKDKSQYNNSNANHNTNNENSESVETSRENLKEPHKNSAESAESKENTEGIDSEEKHSRYSKPHVQDEESIEIDNSNESFKSIKPRNPNENNHTHGTYRDSPRSSSENSDERSDEQIKHKHNEYKNDSLESFKSNTSEPTQDADDFSYERIQVNEKGLVEPLKENHQNKNNDPIIIQTTTKPTADLKKYDDAKALSKESEESSTSIENDESNEPVNINDGEVKPVVEINSDADSVELSEKVTSRSLDTSKENESLETLLGVKIPENNESEEKNNNIVSNQNVKEGDVKQEFERIPLNYKHRDKPQSENSEETAEENPTPTEKTNTNLTNDEGTLDVFTPKEEKFDENLNIKFSDIAIKLPEIKLPEDVLEYARETPSYSYGPKENKDDNDERPRFYNYNEKDSDENTQQKKNSNDDENNDFSPAYYGYYDYGNKKQSYKTDQTEDEDEDEDNEEDDDLYEKFVRERFGKRRSFQKRSEKLQDITSKPHNPQLYDTIQNILKKTEQVRKEAETSGDPKAGYMWTLEYGENA